MITLTQEYIDILASDAMSVCYLVKLPDLAVTSAAYDIAYNGDVYVSDGLLISVDGVNSTTDIRTDTHTIVLDDANQTALSIFGNGNYIGREATISIALQNDDGSLILDDNNNGPIEIFTGLFDGWALKEEKTTSKMNIKLKSHWASFNRTSGRFTNNASQQELYPTDTFFDFSHVDQNEIRWGYSTPD